MSNSNSFSIQVRNSAGMRLALLFGSFFFLLMFSSLIDGYIRGIDGINQRTASLASASVQAIFAFITPALLVAKFSSVNSFDWLRLNRIPSLRGIIGVLIVYVICTPAMNQLIAWNEAMHLPESMSGMEETLRIWEERSQKVTETILRVSSFGGIVSGILIIGVLTGFSEELFFRGSLQRIFTDTSMNKTAAIIIAGFIFSFFHFQFFGFFPRWLMGIFFGFLLVWSKSLWLPIFAHALNNSIVVASYAFIEKEETLEALQGIGVNHPGSLYVFLSSIVLTFVFFLFFRNFFFRNGIPNK